MRIGIDATPAVHQVAGIGRYTRSIIEALLSLDRADDYFAFYAAKGRSLLPEELGYLHTLSRRHGNLSLVDIPLPARLLTILWNRLHLPVPLETLAGTLDLVHWTDFVIGEQRFGRAIATIHDLSFLTVPECADGRLRAYLSRAVPRTARTAEALVAVSQSTKNDLVKLLGVDPRKVHVVYNGVGPEFGRHDTGGDMEVLAKYGLQEPFILTVGTIEPRKNLATLLDAYRILGGKRLPYSLVIAGRRGWLYDGVFRSVERYGLEGKVRFLDDLAAADLPSLYRQAGVFVYPSLYEGFGIPVLEAMACGTPVVSSSSSSLPEAVGDAGLLVDPLDAEALAEAMRRTIEDQRLSAELVERGLNRAKQFTWTAAAERLLDLYRSLSGATHTRR